jgi:hypothetical protein
MFRRLLILASLCVAGLGACTGYVAAQSLEDLNVQIHGFATQGFLYTTNNNIFATTSSDGSPNWTEAVVNISIQPIPKLRIAVQPRYELLGNYSNGFSLDYADADYKVNDEFGVRFGKIKIPTGLLNETQDIDPSYIWSLLPQSVYPLTSRNGQLSQYGGVVYGTLGVEGSPKLGKLEYRAWGGEIALSSDDGYFKSFSEGGLNLPNGLTRTEAGAALHWRTPIKGLMIGASTIKNNTSSGNFTAGGGTVTGVAFAGPYFQPDYFGQYQRGRFMLAAEYTRLAGPFTLQFTGAPPATASRFDDRNMFVMGSYKITEKFSAGAYDSGFFSHSGPLGPTKYSKDFALSGRYDFNQYIYAKAEQHFINGTAQDYEADLNPSGLKPNTHLTILKIGVSF